ncbi:acetylornithine deacetylase/succinyl-diaminopimelate desuccinylase-like protein [Bradyrhizobium sp. USDA 4353]
MFHPTLTINGFHGGHRGPGSKTVLPCEALVKCDIRLVESMTPDDVLAKVEAHVKKHAPEVEFIAHAGMLPSRVPLDSPFAAIIRDEITLAQRVTPLEFPCTGTACRTTSSPRLSVCPPSSSPTAMPTRPTMRRMRT